MMIISLLFLRHDALQIQPLFFILSYFLALKPPPPSMAQKNDEKQTFELETCREFFHWDKFYLTSKLAARMGTLAKTLVCIWVPTPLPHKHHLLCFQARTLNIQTVQTPLFRQLPPIYWFSVNRSYKCWISP